MEERANLYSPPDADVEPHGQAPAFAGGWAPVAIHKYLALSFATFGHYHYYWHYKQWAMQRNARNDGTWPFARAVFFVFCVHEMTGRACAALGKTREETKELRGFASVYVGVLVVMGILGWLESDTVFVVFGLILQTLFLLPLVREVNAAVGDPRGESNARYTFTNLVVLVLGAIWWILVAVDLFGWAD